MKNDGNKKVWIDLDNSPHVPFFKPIIEELDGRGYTFVITARDCFQVCGLADRSGLNYTRIGRHYGKNKLLKVLGLLIRAMQMIPMILRERPALAVSHGSRTQVLVGVLLRIPTIMIFDYEFAKALPIFHSNWILVPDVISESALPGGSCVLKYPGIKEDVYVPSFKPDPGIRQTLGLQDDEVVVTVRPPASEAHYQSPESEKLFQATVKRLAEEEDVRMVMLPRNDAQADLIRAQWPELFSSGKIIIPREVVDGLNLMWYSDFVISGGGTMNREAAALGIPVYSIFRGKIGAVDRYLADNGRLILLETENDVRSKIQLKKRDNTACADCGNSETLKYIVSVIEKAANQTLGRAQV